MATDQVVDYGTREAWLVARHKGIGASESAALFGLSPYDSRFSLWAKKTGPLELDVPAEDDDMLPEDIDPAAERMEWGHLLETPIAARYEKITKRKLWHFSDFCIAQHPRIGAMLATIDRFIVEAQDLPGKEGILEIKNSANVTVWRQGPPQYYLCQVQHQLAVTGRDFATLAVLLGGNRLRFWDIERNPDFIAELEIQVSEFWTDVEAKRKPAVDGHKATIEALKKLHPQDNGNEVTLPAEAVTWWQQLAEAKRMIKAGEAMRDAADASLRAAIGDNTYGILPGGLRLSLKTTSNPGYSSVVKPYTYRTLREEKEPKKANAAAFHAGRKSAQRKAS